MRLRRIFLALAWLAFASTMAACRPAPQQSSYLMPDADREVLADVLERSERCAWQEKSLIDSLSVFFLDYPYLSAALESDDGVERLSASLQGFDCMTFVESVAALKAVVLRYHPQTFPLDSCARLFPDKIREIRYRGGCLSDYTSRLHYASDWLADNLKKGVLADLTGEFTGEIFQPCVGYMSQHPDKYTALTLHPEYLPAIREREEAVNAMRWTCLPKTDLLETEADIPSGCLVLISTSTPGLDFAHMGITARRNGRLYLIHASSSYRKVMFTEAPLYDYLAKIGRFKGIVLCSVR